MYYRSDLQFLISFYVVFGGAHDDMQFYETDKHIINNNNIERNKQLQLAQQICVHQVLIAGGGGLWNSGRLGYLRSKSREASSSGYFCMIIVHTTGCVSSRNTDSRRVDPKAAMFQSESEPDGRALVTFFLHDHAVTNTHETIQAYRNGT